MPWPGKLETLDDLRQWAAHHEGEIQAWWREQWKSNERCDQDLKAIEKLLQPLPAKCRQLEREKDDLVGEMEKLVELMDKLRIGQAVHNVRIVIITTALLLALTQGLPLLWKLLG